MSTTFAKCPEHGPRCGGDNCCCYDKHRTDLELAESLEQRVSDAVTELEAVHQSADGRLCDTCGAAGGSWPCVSKMVAEDLQAALSEES